jgi:hypothetical protein
LSSEELMKLRRDTSVRKFLASLGRILGRGNGS